MMIKKSNLYAPGNKPHYINLYCPNCNHVIKTTDEELGRFNKSDITHYIVCKYCKHTFAI